MDFQEVIRVGRKSLRNSQGLLDPVDREPSADKALKSEGFPRPSSHQRLLNSFPGRKNAELKEYSRGSERPGQEKEVDDQMALVFFLTRKLLSKTAAPGDIRSLPKEDRLERALEKIHPRLPLSIRLILRKKQYIRLMMDNRERLIP